MNLTARSAVLQSLVIAAAIACGSAFAQSADVEKEKVLKESQVSEQSLIDALTPPARTRSWKPGVAAAGAAGAVAPQTAKASILVTFVTGKSDLTADAKKALDVLAGAMKSERLAAVKFTIEGHADPRGSEELNLKLSQSRAESVRDYLTASHGLAAERVNAVGKGSSALMKPSEPAAAENRRVTIVAQQKE
jgi:outer membrane protein OmpA-like peptidoglycan-associated protein